MSHELLCPPRRSQRSPLPTGPPQGPTARSPWAPPHPVGSGGLPGPASGQELPARLRCPGARPNHSRSASALSWGPSSPRRPGGGRGPGGGHSRRVSQPRLSSPRRTVGTQCGHVSGPEGDSPALRPAWPHLRPYPRGTWFRQVGGVHGRWDAGPASPRAPPAPRASRTPEPLCDSRCWTSKRSQRTRGGRRRSSSGPGARGPPRGGVGGGNTPPPDPGGGGPARSPCTALPSREPTPHPASRGHRDHQAQRRHARPQGLSQQQRDPLRTPRPPRGPGGLAEPGGAGGDLAPQSCLLNEPVGAASLVLGTGAR